MCSMSDGVIAIVIPFNLADATGAASVYYSFYDIQVSYKSLHVHIHNKYSGYVAC